MDAIGRFTTLFAYPDDGYRARAEACARETGSAAMREFAARLVPLSTGEIQEQFIQAFDLNPASTLEIGWHLFGEQYERGEFLVGLRKRLRKAGIAEVGELPDHLLHVLPLVSRLAPEDARAFVDRVLAPAVATIAAGLPNESIFAALVRALLDHVRRGAEEKRSCHDVHEGHEVHKGPFSKGLVPDRSS